MKSPILLAIAVGAGVGSLATFLVMRELDTVSQVTEVVTHSADTADEDRSTDPFKTSQEQEATEDADDYPFAQMDMTDPAERDRCTSL